MYIDNKTEKILAMILHLSGFLNGTFPIIIPLIIWLLKKDESYFIREHGKAALNFQLSILILGTVAALFVFLTIGLGATVVIPLAIIFGFLYIYFIVIATLAAYNGQLYRYPFSLEIIK
ncbi:DUF4870 domain-containing protein [Wenyingzhuangia sp. 1_MG-2023]|nr:DUF4870 domain-containing protein [Wenyingzhuangia sp. 1_MG-2023]